MAAVNVGLTAANLLAADPDQHRSVIVQNLGPNAIYLEIGAAAAVATGFKVLAAATSPMIPLHAGNALSAIAETAAQTSPANTRVITV